MLFGTLFTLPDASTTLSNLGAYSVPVVSDFLPLIYVVGGISLALLVVGFVIYLFTRHTTNK